MVEVDKVIEEIANTIQDTSYNNDRIVDEINNCLNFVASSFNVTSLVTDSEITVLANTDRTNMPENYLREVFSVIDAEGQDLLILSNIKSLLKHYDSFGVGNIRAVAVAGSILHCRPMPSVDTVLHVHYYRQSEQVVSGMLMPSWLPQQLQIRLPKYFALNKFYLEIEDGINSPAVNTEKYGQLVASALSELTMFYPRASKQSPFIERKLSWF